jgi:hypothetical protein
LVIQEWVFIISVICLFEFLTLFTLVGHNFLISNPFSTIVSVSNAPGGGVQVLFGHKNNGALPLDLAFPEQLNVQSPIDLPYNYFEPYALNAKFRHFILRFNKIPLLCRQH